MVPRNKPENPEQVIDEIVDLLHERKVLRTNQAVHIGYVEDTFNAYRSAFLRLDKDNLADPEKKRIAELSINSFTAYRDELLSTQEQYRAIYGNTPGILGSAGSVLATAGTTTTLLDVSPSIRPVAKLSQKGQRLSSCGKGSSPRGWIC